MSEIVELVDELKSRYQSWRARTRSRDEVAPALEEVYEASPDVDFTTLDPRSSDENVPLHDFADVSVAWIQTHTTREVFAQGRKCYLDKQVTRVHAHGPRMTGTTKERGYCDQEITLRDGTLAAKCSCAASRAPATPLPPVLPAPNDAGKQADKRPDEQSDKQPDARTLACKHVVAILLAYINPSETRGAMDAPRPKTDRPPLVCPVTRQTLSPSRPLYQCEQCGTCFSAEGWKFLQDADKGRCCGCDTRNTIKSVVG